MDEKEPWIIIGDYIDTWGESTRVGLPMADLKVHTSVLGTTGSGKSTFLRHLACQFFSLGGTVIVIEPHGDLILDEEEGILAYGPFPADGFFGSGAYTNYDAILAMYHDQGLIPFKTLSFQNFHRAAGLDRLPCTGTTWQLHSRRLQVVHSLLSLEYGRRIQRDRSVIGPKRIESARKRKNYVVHESVSSSSFFSIGQNFSL